MFNFLNLKYLVNNLKFTAVFLLLVIVPLLGILFYDRHRQRTRFSPMVYLMEQCLQRSASMHTDDCIRLNKYIHGLIASLKTFFHLPAETDAAFKQSDSPTSLVRALEIFPLLCEISQPDSCCEGYPHIGKDHFPKFLDCKSTVRGFLVEIDKKADPLLREELDMFTMIREKTHKARRYYKILSAIFLMFYCMASMEMTQYLLKGEGNRYSAAGFYLVSLACFTASHKFSYFRVFQKYRKKHKSLLV